MTLDPPHPPDPGVLLDSLPTPLVAVDAGWRCVYMNRAAAKQENAPGEQVGRGLWDAFPALLAAGPHLRRVMETRRAGVVEVEAPAPAFWLEVRASPCGDGLTVQWSDITDRRRREERREGLLDLTRTLAGVGNVAEAAHAVRDLAARTLGVGEVALWRPPEGGFPGEREPALALPLTAEGETLGVLTLHLRPGRELDREELDFAYSLADMLARALDRLRAAEASGRALAGLDRERERLLAVLDQMPAAIWIAEVPGGRLIAGNRAIETILRHPYRPGANLGDYGGYVGYHPDGRRYESHEWPLARTVLTGGGVEGEEVEMERGDGTRGFVRYASALIETGGEGPALAVVTGVDVTELRELSARLEERVEARTRELVGRMAELAAETAALQAFASFTELTGHEADLGVLTRAAAGVLHRALGEGSTGYYEREGELWRQTAWDGNMDPATLLAAETGFPAELPLFAGPAASGEPLFVEGWRESGHVLAPHTPEYGAIAVAPVTVRGGTVGLLAAGLREKTGWSERDRAVFRAVGRALGLAAERAEGARVLAGKQAELEAANRDLEAFVSSASHDLRAPVRHIAGFAGVLRRAVEADTPAARYAGLIEESAGRMAGLIDSLLAFARLGAADLHKTEVALGDLVAAVREDLAPGLGERRVEWRVGALPVVSGDPALLRQALQNLLGNAVKYSRPREVAVIEVWAAREGPEHVLHVRDNGVGFDPRRQGELFEVFRRLHGPREFEGDGVGLASVQRIVHRHGGRLWAEGEVGRGATFTFTLPA